MHKINTTTKKFTEAVTIDLGQLPTVDTRIDFILTDGTNPVIAENKTFAMTIGSVLGSLYKTDEDTVSFRYLKFNDDNIADSLVITMTMDGVEILNDVVSLKYQRECIDKDALEEAINAKADKATTIAGYGITDAYTKTEIDAKVASVYHYKGTVSAYAGLPASGQEVGDVWNIETADSTHGIKAGDNVAWTGTEWDVLAGEIDLSAYATKTELETKMDAPATPGTVGQVLTKTADGQEWADAPAGGGGEDTTDYLCFTAGQANSTVNLKKEGNPDTITLEYSTDGKQTWTDYAWDTNDGTTITLANANDAVFFRAKSTNAHTGKGWSDYHHFVFSGVIFASGNVMSLLDKTCTLMEVIDKFCFVYLFSSNYLYSAPKLPATKLTGERCYAGMFSGCTSLKEMPDLPAIILSKWCYDSMFEGCTSLVSVKNIPLVPMVEGCFSSMFRNCTALRKMPELPATKLARSCYEYMFQGCRSLEDTTVLPATTLPEECYCGMFQYCKSLKKVPQIKATTFSDAYIRGVFESMFYECTNLIDGDFGVPIDVTKSRILFETFNECPSLEKAPSFTGATVGSHAFIRTFKGCTSLHYIKPSWTTWNTKNPSDDWFDNASQTGIFDCSASLDTTTYVPTGWTVTHGANNPDIDTTSAVEAMTTDIYTVCPSSKETGVLTVSSTLTLNAYPVSSTDIAYAEIVLDVATGATVTAGTNLTLVDTPTAGKRNICVCRWGGGVCKLYVTIVEDLPQA